jgi:hypothetical protein
MDPSKLTTYVSLLVALSVASERLVEITKGLIPWLNAQNSDPGKEGKRRAVLQVMAVAAGVGTAFLARPAIGNMVPEGILPTLALGLLASGGSGFWNSILTYVTSLKDLNKVQIQQGASAIAAQKAAGK